MKKLLLIIPFALIGCVSPEQSQRNLAVMQGIQYNQQANQAVYQNDQAIYQQGLENQQRQEILNLQRQQLEQQNNPRSYIITDQYGNGKTFTVKPQQNGFRKIPSVYR